VPSGKNKAKEAYGHVFHGFTAQPSLAAFAPHDAEFSMGWELFLIGGYAIPFAASALQITRAFTAKRQLVNK
jgi:hypothetical protein